MGTESDDLKKLSQEWSLAVSPETCDRLQAFVSLLMEWNVRINLTGAKSRQDLVGEHLVDSYAMTRFLPAGSSVVDIGAGGGLPGIPLAILRPDLRITMVEPRAKRVAFLRTAVHQLDLLQVEILRCRSDELRTSSFDACASRATFSPEEWLRIGRDLVKAGGVILIFTNAPWGPVGPEARLVDSAIYKTGSGRPRWIGACCFT